MKVWICYDLRTFDNQDSSARLTAAAIEQAAWADDQPFDAVLLPEHHGSPDGYVSSPFVLGAAIAARTSRIRIVTAAVLLPLLDPIRVAEDAATLDVISQGRLTLGVGLGYGPSEFEMFGVSFDERVSKLESGIAVLRQAFTGEEFSYQGRRARVTPRPVQPAGPPIYVCGAVKAAARRAARLADGFSPATTRSARTTSTSVHGWASRAWAAIAPHAAHDTAMYTAWAEGATKYGRMDTHYHQASDHSADHGADYRALRAAGVQVTVTPEQCVALVQQAERNGHLVNFKPLMGGMPPERHTDDEHNRAVVERIAAEAGAFELLT